MLPTPATAGAEPATHESHVLIPADAAPAPSEPPYKSPSPALQAFINRTLKLSITDGRFFIGELMCTDRDKNIVLANTTEYRPPSEGVAAVEVEGDTVKAQLTSRMIGLVVVPGRYITKIELEETRLVRTKSS